MIPTRAGEVDRPRDMARRAKKEGAACCGPTKPKRRCRHEAHGRGKPRPYESGDESKEWRREVAATKPKMASRPSRDKFRPPVQNREGQEFAGLCGKLRS